MKSSKFIARSVVLVIALAAAAVFSGCSGDKDTLSSAESSSQETVSAVSAESASDSAESDISQTEADFSVTMGSWMLASGEGDANIVMNGIGNFASYDEDGAVQASGNVEYSDESDGGHYDLYSDDGTLIASIYFDNDSRFHIGEDASAYYEKYVGSSGTGNSSESGAVSSNSISSN